MGKSEGQKDGMTIILKNNIKQTMFKKHLISIAIIVLFTLQVHGTTIILTSDQQLNDLLNLDKKIDMSTGFTKRYASLRDVCEYAKKKGDHTFTIAFDEFFRQYHEQAATERKLTPDMDVC